MTDPKTRRLAAILGVFFLVIAASLTAIHSVAAGTVSDIVNTIIASMFEVIFDLIGFLLIQLLKGLIWVAQYNDYVSAPAIIVGWVVVRDIANMFFVVGMLVMAFATILGVDAYSYKNKNLTRMLLMAIIVNFSRTICGLFIDISQVVMLTFVNGFKDAAAGNFTKAFNITDMVQKNSACQSAAQQTSNVMAALTAYILGTVFLVVAIGIVILIIAFLVSRMITLWGLVVLSPLAYALRGMPLAATKSYFGKWWSMFVQQLTAGPVLAFFLWLALAIVSQSPPINAETSEGPPASPSCIEGLGVNKIMQFIIAIGMMYSGVKFAQEMAGGGGFPGQKLGQWVNKKLRDTAYRYSGAERVVRAGKAAWDERQKRKEERYTEKVTSTTAAFQGAFGAVDRGVGGIGAGVRKAILGGKPEEAGMFRRGLAGVAETILPGGRERAQLGVAEAKAAKSKEAGLVDNAKKAMTNDEAKNFAQHPESAVSDYQRQAAMLKATEEGGNMTDEKGNAISKGNIGAWHEEMKKNADADTLKSFEEAAKKKNLVEARELRSDKDVLGADGKPVLGPDGKPIKQKVYTDEAYNKDLNGGKLSIADMSPEDVGKLSSDLLGSQAAEQYEKSMNADQRKAYAEALSNRANQQNMQAIYDMPQNTDEERAARDKQLAEASKIREAVMRNDKKGDMWQQAFSIKDGKFGNKGEEEAFKKMMSKPGAAGALMGKLKAEDIANPQTGNISGLGETIASIDPNTLSQLSKKVLSEGGTNDARMMGQLIAAIKGGHGKPETRDVVMKSRQYDQFPAGNVRDKMADQREGAMKRQEMAKERMAKVGELKDAQKQVVEATSALADFQSNLERTTVGRGATIPEQKELEARQTAVAQAVQQARQKAAEANVSENLSDSGVEEITKEIKRIKDDIASALKDGRDDLVKDANFRLGEAEKKLSSRAGVPDAEKIRVEVEAEIKDAGLEVDKTSQFKVTSADERRASQEPGANLAGINAAAEELKRAAAAMQDVAGMNREAVSQMANDISQKLGAIKPGQEGAGGMDQKGVDTLAAAFKQYGADMKSALEKQGMTLTDVAGKLSALKAQKIDTSLLEKSINSAFSKGSRNEPEKKTRRQK